MINICRDAPTHAPFQFRALLPSVPIPPAGETFALLDGNRTVLASSASASAQPASRLALSFSSTSPATPLPERHGKFSEAERDNILCLLASPDGRFGSLKIAAAVHIYTSRLGSGHQITFRIRPGHHLWLRPASGQLTLDGQALEENDIATVAGENQVTIGALSDSEFLMLDLS